MVSVSTKSKRFEIFTKMPTTSLPFDLSFFDMLQRKDKVNTFRIKEDVRDVLLFFLQVFLEV